MFHQLLGLGLEWEVIDSRFDEASGTVYLEIRETPRLWESLRCPKDGEAVFCYDHTEVLTWRHLNVFQHRCEITCALPRGKCRRCGDVFRVRPPWEGLCKHFTREFEAFALLLLREMPVKKVGQIVGETDTRLWRMIFRHVEAAYEEADFSQVCHVGVDEMNVRKGQEYISVFADLSLRRVLYAVEGHDHSVWQQFVQALAEHNGNAHALTQVSMDMSAAYQRGVRENCPNAQMVFDKFHVIARANAAVDRVRQAEVRFGGAEVWQSLRRSAWLWRKNPGNLSTKEARRLHRLEHKNLRTAKAYQMRLILQDIYRSADVTVARRRFRIWCRWVKWAARWQPGNLLQAMVKVANMVEQHLEGILAHWKAGLTNAFMEGLNSVFSATKRKARGYRSTTHLITMLYFIAGKLRIPQT